MTVAPDTRQVLLDAADLLDANGWCQGTLMNHEKQRCAVGAIYHTVGHGVSHLAVAEDAMVDRRSSTTTKHRASACVRPGAAVVAKLREVAGGVA